MNHASWYFKTQQETHQAFTRGTRGTGDKSQIWQLYVISVFPSIHVTQILYTIGPSSLGSVLGGEHVHPLVLPFKVPIKIDEIDRRAADVYNALRII